MLCLYSVSQIVTDGDLHNDINSIFSIVLKDRLDVLC